MSQFDQYSSNYDHVLNEGLRVTGEDKDYFATSRVGWTARRLAEFGTATTAVLDFGCGTGASVPLLARELRAATVTGVDDSRPSLHEARRAFTTSGVRFVHVSEMADVGPFDVAYVNGVFHHVAPSERPETLAGIASTLKPGGVVALWENNPYNPGARWVMRRLPFDRDAVMLRPSETRRLVQSAGLLVLSTDYCFFFPRLLAALRPLEPGLRSLPLGGQYVVFGRRPSAASR
jgi:SAM-dependent methyltransferase